MPQSVDQLVEEIAATGLLRAEAIHELLARTAADRHPRTRHDLLALLEAAGLLTRWQAAQLATGGKIPLVLDTYVLLDRIGAGGMGEVFKAEHRRMERIVALKLLHGHRIDSPETLERFLREAKAAGRLVHPNIVHAYDADEALGHHFLVMEFVDGCDLAELGRRRRIQIDEAARYILQAARGLDFAHRQGVVHRDIKPANLLLDSSGVVKILDMGIARLEPAVRQGSDETEAQLTEAGLIMGTVDFMSPEQALDFRNADARSDIYSLGCTLFYLIAGKPAYSGKTVVEKIFAHRDIPLPSLRAARDDVPEPLDAIAARMMAKERAARFQTMADVIAALEQFAGGQPVVIEPTIRLTIEAADPRHAIDAPTGSVSLAETPTAALRPARDRLVRYIEGCGGVDKFLDDEEEQNIFRRGGELELSLAEIADVLDERCSSGGWTRHSKLTAELTRQLQAAVDDDGAIAQHEFESVVDHAVASKMPRKSAEENCLTLMLDNKWRAREGFFTPWFQRKLKQYGLE